MDKFVKQCTVHNPLRQRVSKFICTRIDWGSCYNTDAKSVGLQGHVGPVILHFQPVLRWCFAAGSWILLWLTKLTRFFLPLSLLKALGNPRLSRPVLLSTPPFTKLSSYRTAMKALGMQLRKYYTTTLMVFHCIVNQEFYLFCVSMCALECVKVLYKSVQQAVICTLVYGILYGNLSEPCQLLIMRRSLCPLKPVSGDSLDE